MSDAINLSIVLVAPEIPGNTGAIGRTCVALNASLILIKPIAFDISEKAVRRAGLDYWKYVDLTVCDDWEQFIEKFTPKREQLFLTSRFATQSIYHADLSAKMGKPFLIFGSETVGLSEKITSQYQDRLYSLPSFSQHIRSLNLANAATAIAYEAVRQQLFKI